MTPGRHVRAEQAQQASLAQNSTLARRTGRLLTLFLQESQCPVGHEPWPVLFSSERERRQVQVYVRWGCHIIVPKKVKNRQQRYHVFLCLGSNMYPSKRPFGPRHDSAPIGARWGLLLVTDDSTAMNRHPIHVEHN